MADPSETAASDQRRAAAVEMVDMLVESSVEAYRADATAGNSDAGREWSRVYLRPLFTLPAEELLPVLIEALGRLAIHQLREAQAERALSDLVNFLADHDEDGS